MVFWREQLGSSLAYRYLWVSSPPARAPTSAGHFAVKASAKLPRAGDCTAHVWRAGALLQSPPSDQGVKAELEEAPGWGLLGNPLPGPAGGFWQQDREQIGGAAASESVEVLCRVCQCQESCWFERYQQRADVSGSAGQGWALGRTEPKQHPSKGEPWKVLGGEMVSS